MSTTDNPKQIVLSGKEWSELTDDLNNGVRICGCPESTSLRDAVLDLRRLEGRLTAELESELPILIDQYSHPENFHPPSTSLQKLRDKLRFATR